MSSFPELSQKIADDFLQTIAFIDDEASYTESTEEHRLNAGKVIDIFASREKACTVFKVTKRDDLENIVRLLKRCDVTVLDWRINLTENTKPDKATEEEDADDDVRGAFTLEIIKQLLKNDTGKLKLIVVYTGETDLSGIAQAINTDLKKNGFDASLDDFTNTFNNYRITVIGKASLKSTAQRLRKEVTERLFEYEELPDLIAKEFSQISQGLLSAVTLKAIAVIRENTFALINRFDKSLDSAFLSHKALLPIPEDASEQILDLIGSDIKSMIKAYNTSEAIEDNNIQNFIDEKYGDTVAFEFQDRESFKAIQIPLTLDKATLKAITIKGVEQVFVKKEHPFDEVIRFSKTCHKNLTDSYSGDSTISNESNARYAILTTLKTFYNKAYIPPLTQGTILKVENNADEYWLCIQPKCDCIRITNAKRNFLFLKLKVAAPENFDILLENNLFLKVVYTTYAAKFFTFKKAANGSVMPLDQPDGSKKFQAEGIAQKMLWYGELKSDYAQSIANEFAAQIARVGMDHSEWLRRSS